MADDLYLKQQEASEPTHVEAFGLARAASAVAFASQGELNEAVYEALYAFSTEEPIIQLIERRLRNEA